MKCVAFYFQSSICFSKKRIAYSWQIVFASSVLNYTIRITTIFCFQLSSASEVHIHFRNIYYSCLQIVWLVSNVSSIIHKDLTIVSWNFAPLVLTKELNQVCRLPCTHKTFQLATKFSALPKHQIVLSLNNSVTNFIYTRWSICALALTSWLMSFDAALMFLH